MYLADELPPEDRAEVQQLLDSDANLRAQIGALRGTDATLRSDARADLDAGAMRLREAALVRDTGRLIRQWQVDRAATAASATTPGDLTLRSRWWLYPVAAAAVVAVIFIAWWGGPGEVPNLPPDHGVDQAIAQHLQNIEEATLTARAERLENLNDAESQMAALDALASSNTTFLDGVDEQNR